MAPGRNAKWFGAIWSYCSVLILTEQWFGAICRLSCLLLFPLTELQFGPIGHGPTGLWQKCHMAGVSDLSCVADPLSRYSLFTDTPLVSLPSQISPQITYIVTWVNPFTWDPKYIGTLIRKQITDQWFRAIHRLFSRFYKCSPEGRWQVAFEYNSL